jgi:hypothetical protein
MIFHVSQQTTGVLHNVKEQNSSLNQNATGELPAETRPRIVWTPLATSDWRMPISTGSYPLDFTCGPQLNIAMFPVSNSKQ